MAHPRVRSKRNEKAESKVQKAIDAAVGKKDVKVIISERRRNMTNFMIESAGLPKDAADIPPPPESNNDSSDEENGARQATQQRNRQDEESKNLQ